MKRWLSSILLCGLVVTFVFSASRSSALLSTQTFTPSPPPVSSCSALNSIRPARFVGYGALDGSVHFTISNNGAEVVYVTGFELVWPDPTHPEINQSSGLYYLRQVVQGNSASDPGGTILWTSVGAGHDATGNTKTVIPHDIATDSTNQLEGTWQFNGILYPGENEIWLDFDGFEGSIRQLEVLRHHFNGSRFFLSVGQPCDGISPTPTPTDEPSPTQTLTITPSPSLTPTFTPSVTLDPCGPYPIYAPTAGIGGDSAGVRTTPCPPTLTPEPTGTSEPRQPVQLLINPDFAQPIPSPRGWGIKNVPGSRKDDRMRYDADLGVFMFKGGPGEKSKIKQTLRLDLLPLQTGDQLTLTMSYRKAGPQPNLRAKIDIEYRDGTSRSTQVVTLTKMVNRYRSASHSIQLKSPAVSTVVVSIIHKSPSKKTKVFIDRVELWWMPTP